MTGDELPDSDHVVRYVKPSNVQNGIVNAEEFVGGNNGVSVNWLEYFQERATAEQLGEVRHCIQLTIRRNGRFARLNIGETKYRVSGAGRNLDFLHDPQEARPPFEPDPSHSLIAGLPAEDSPEAMLVADMISECMLELHPAIP